MADSTSQGTQQDRPYLPCRHIVEFLVDYLDGALETAPRQEFERHLAACPNCVRYVKSYEATIRLGKSAMCGPTDALQEPMPEDLVKAITAAMQRRDADGR